MNEHVLCGEYEKDTAMLDRLLRVNESFDAIKREFVTAGCAKSALYFIDGMMKDQVMNKIMEYMVGATDPESCFENVPYVEIERAADPEHILYMFMSGAAVFVTDGFREAQIMDTRTYPVRSIEEPENDRVLRGPHEGFVETLIFNTAMIRRRIRDRELTMTMVNTHGSSKCDVALCYMNGRADEKLLAGLIGKLENLPVDAVSMGAESIAECLIGKRWYNPFPKIRYTERPDAAAAMILEGSIILICDNSPMAMILPTSIFDFLQTSDDFYFPPLIGSYLRLLRLAVFVITLLLVPTWYLFIREPRLAPEALNVFLVTDTDIGIPVFVQLIVVELVIDGLKMASMNTPSSLTNSLSVVGGLILGDFAVNVGWLLPQVIIFMAFVAIANFTQQSYELGYAFKFTRMLLLTLTAAFGVYGYAVGIVLSLVLVATNKTVEGSRGYLYPLIPFNGRALKRLILRVKLK